MGARAGAIVTALGGWGGGGIKILFNKVAHIAEGKGE